MPYIISNIGISRCPHFYLSSPSPTFSFLSFVTFYLFSHNPLSSLTFLSPRLLFLISVFHLLFSTLLRSHVLCFVSHLPHFCFPFPIFIYLFPRLYLSFPRILSLSSCIFSLSPTLYFIFHVSSSHFCISISHLPYFYIYLPHFYLLSSTSPHLVSFISS